jgi:hypothetical protein
VGFKLLERGGVRILQSEKNGLTPMETVVRERKWWSHPYLILHTYLIQPANTLANMLNIGH